jgi:hypothetical protein
MERRPAVVAGAPLRGLTGWVERACGLAASLRLGALCGRVAKVVQRRRGGVYTVRELITGEDRITARHLYCPGFKLS